MSERALVDIQVANHIQVMRLSRPEKKNAINAEMYRVLSDALEHGDGSDGVRVHVIVGRDGTFSAGNDLTDFLTTGETRDRAMAEVLRFIRLLPQIRKPLIAGVDGLAVGIGTTLLFHCDLVFASDRVSFSTPFVDLGLIPEAGSSLLAPMRLGYARAFELLVLGQTFSAEQLREAGLVNAVLPPSELEPATFAAAAALATKPPHALAISRRLLRGDPTALNTRIEKEAELFAQRLIQSEAIEALSAFTQKRPPNFSK